MKPGGMVSTSAYGFNDELTVQISGSRKQTASTTNTAYSTTFDPIRAGNHSVLSRRVVHHAARS
jgi:hypothetical protein